MIVTPTQRKLAHTQAADMAEVLTWGVPRAQKIGTRVQARTLAALRRRENPITVLRSEAQTMLPLVRDAMTLARLIGMERATRFTPAVGFARSVFGEAMRFLGRRLKLSPSQLSRMADAHEAQAARILDRSLARLETQAQRVFVAVTEQGLHVRDGVNQLADFFATNGLTPANSFTLEQIFRTQTALAYGAGKVQMERSPEIDEILWGYRYVTVGDNRVRPSHRGLDGVTLPKNDARWSQIYPPNGFACRCQVIPVFEPAQTIDPPQSIEFEGRVYEVKPDKGFSFNPGALLTAA